MAEGFTATRVCASDEAISAVLTSFVAIDDISGNVFLSNFRSTRTRSERGSEEATEFRPSWIFFFFFEEIDQAGMEDKGQVCVALGRIDVS